MILIIGSEEETHSKYVYDALVSRGYEAEYFDSRQYPDNISLGFMPNSKEGFIKINEKTIPIEVIKGVYWRWFYGFNEAKVEDSYTAKMVLRERISALNSLFMSLECNLVNSFKAIELHKTKIYQLDIMAKNGIRVPKTFVTNDADALVEFWENNNRNVIFKPVLGGAYTKKLTESDLTKDNLKKLKISPVQLQECIDGVDIRVYAMGDKIFPAEIQAKTVDFRADNNPKHLPVKLPQDIENNCKKVLNILNLAYSGIDIRKSNEGEYVFIEANTAPMFIYFEEVTKYPVTESLIELLVK